MIEAALKRQLELPDVWMGNADLLKSWGNNALASSSFFPHNVSSWGGLDSSSLLTFLLVTSVKSCTFCLFLVLIDVISSLIFLCFCLEMLKVWTIFRTFSNKNHCQDLALDFNFLAQFQTFSYCLWDDQCILYQLTNLVGSQWKSIVWNHKHA